MNVDKQKMYENFPKLMTTELLGSVNKMSGWDVNRGDCIPIKFRVNNEGFRSPDNFDKNKKMLTLGCSITYGQGLPDEYRWPEMLAKKLNIDFANLAWCGDSAIAQIMKCFLYFEKYGHPEIIVALFPFGRMITPHVPDKLVRKNDLTIENRFKDERATRTQSIAIHEDDFKKYAKSPYDPLEIFPIELAFLYEKAMLQMLEQYCNSHNIKFFWSCWDWKYKDFAYPHIKKDHPLHHKNYVDIDCNSWHLINTNQDFVHLDKNWVNMDLLSWHKQNSKYAPITKSNINCHLEQSDDFLFDNAADRNDIHPPHYGLHRHIHWTEGFYEAIKDKL